MLETLNNAAIDLLLNGVKSKVNDEIKKKKWRELFTEAGEFLSDNPDTSQRFANDLGAMFSEDNMKNIAEKLRDKRGYDFPKLLHDNLYDLMAGYEIPQLEAETYIKHFVNVILADLAKNDHDRTLEIYLGDFRKEFDSQICRIEAKIELVLNQVSGLKKENVEPFSINDIDLQIRKESKFKGIGLDFFKLDDEQFELRFKEAIKTDRVYVVGKSREETIYRILNYLRGVDDGRVALVIKSEEEWNRLQFLNVANTILIPFFYAERISVVSNNTSIFVYGEDEPCYDRNKLVLRKRTRRDIVQSLENIGIDGNEAYNLVEDTHGLYIPLKKRLFNGATYLKPLWAEQYSGTVIAALLCGKWTKATGDILVFEELAGKSYSECEKELCNFLYTENPYIVSHKSYKGNSIQLACVEDAWEELDIFISDDIWDKYIELFYEVLIESEPLFEYPFEKHYAASIYAEKPEWSPTLKEGMIRTLIMRAYYRGHEENQRQIDAVVKRVLDTINSKERWGYISQYICDLCEASPESVLRKLESELEEPTGLLELFDEKQGDFLTSRNYYTNILWAVEQLLQQKKYVFRAVNWLWKVDSLDIKYSISNSPRETLDVVFCAWMNESALTADQKISAASEAVDKYANAWNIIAAKLPSGTTSVCSPLNGAKYRECDENKALTSADINRTYVEYLRICAVRAHENPNRWNELIHHLGMYDRTIRSEVLAVLLTDCEEMDDKEKHIVKIELRKEIFSHRYLWPEEDKATGLSGDLENVLEKISLGEKTYDYLYIFLPRFDFPLLNPEPFNPDGGSELHNKNSSLREEEIKSRISAIKSSGHSIEKLVDLAIDCNCSKIGEVLAEFYCDCSYDDSVFTMLLEKDNEGNQVFDYVWTLLIKGDINLKYIVEKVKKLSDNTNLLVNLILLETVNDSEKAIITNASEEIKKMYWKKKSRVRISDDAKHDVLLWAIDECKKYGSLGSYLELLFDLRKGLSDEELLDSFIVIEHLKEDSDAPMTDYYLKQILERLQKKYINNEEKCSQLAKLEWMCRNILEWDQMVCVQKYMKENPLFYAQLVQIVYKADGEDNNDEKKKELANKVYAGFDKARFCPTEKNGKVEYSELKRWIDKFKTLLKMQSQEKLFDHMIGRLLAYSPVGEDGFSPCEAVRRIIEEYFSDSLKTEYMIAEENKRGVHYVDAGKSELELYQKYRNNACALQEKYPHTAEIYFAISDDYKSEADYERKRAEDEW